MSRPALLKPEIIKLLNSHSDQDIAATVGCSKSYAHKVRSEFESDSDADSEATEQSFTDAVLDLGVIRAERLLGQIRRAVQTLGV